MKVLVKKCLAFVLALSLAIGFSSLNAHNVLAASKGDVNNDSLINAEDALLVLKHAAKVTTLNNTSTADIDGDKVINANDALYILKYAAKVITSFPSNVEDNISNLISYVRKNGTKSGNYYMTFQSYDDFMSGYYVDASVAVSTNKNKDTIMLMVMYTDKDNSEDSHTTMLTLTNGNSLYSLITDLEGEGSDISLAGEAMAASDFKDEATNFDYSILSAGYIYNLYPNLVTSAKNTAQKYYPLSNKVLNTHLNSILGITLQDLGYINISPVMLDN